MEVDSLTARRFLLLRFTCRIRQPPTPAIGAILRSAPNLEPFRRRNQRIFRSVLARFSREIIEAQLEGKPEWFRPGRWADDAVRRAQGYVQEWRRWDVDVDLERFFDRVNGDVLMGELSKRIEDKRVLRVIRRYLDAGVLSRW